MTEDANVPAAVSQSGFDRQTARLRLNFRVAAITNVVAVTILLGFATAAIVFAVLGQPLAAAISGSVGVLDVIYGALERPWRQLWIANNRIALTESVWIAYLESKDAIEREGEPRWRLSMLGRAQNEWINRTAVISVDNFEAAVEKLLRINNAAPDVLEAISVGTETVGVETPSTAPQPVLAAQAKSTDWVTVADRLARGNQPISASEVRARRQKASQRHSARRFVRGAEELDELVASLLPEERLELPGKVDQDGDVPFEISMEGFTAVPSYLQGDWITTLADDLPKLQVSERTREFLRGVASLIEPDAVTETVKP